MKNCSRCKVSKSEDQFSKKYDKFQSECKECRAELARKNYADNRQKFLDRAKIRNAEDRLRIKSILDGHKSNPCVDCQLKYPPECMDFDHVRGEKVANVSTLSRWNNLALLKAEIAKCEVVCSNCHRIRTTSRMKQINGG